MMLAVFTPKAFRMGPSGYFHVLVASLMSLLSFAVVAHTTWFGAHPWGRDGQSRVTRKEQPARYWVCVGGWLLLALLSGSTAVGLWSGDIISRGDRIWGFAPKR